MPTVDFVRHLAAWYEAHRPEAGVAGVTLKFGRNRDDILNPSAWLTAEIPDRIADLLLWSSGEAEFGAGGEGWSEFQEHHDLESEEQLDALLDRLLAYVAR